MNLEELTIYSRRKDPDVEIALSDASIKFVFQHESIANHRINSSEPVIGRSISSARLTFRDDLAKKMVKSFGEYFSFGIDENNERIVLIPDKNGYKLSRGSNKYRPSMSVPMAALNNVASLFWDCVSSEVLMSLEFVDKCVVLTKHKEA